MAAHATEWQISQRLVQLDRDQVMDNFLKECKGFACFLCLFS